MKKTLIAAAAGAIGALGSAGSDVRRARLGRRMRHYPNRNHPRGNIICNIQSNGSSFAMSVSPGYNLSVSLLVGNEDNPDAGPCRGPAHDVRQ